MWETQLFASATAFIRFHILPPSEMKSLYGSITRSAVSCFSYVTRAMVVSPIKARETSLPLDQLLASVDVERRARDRRVRHQVDGQCADVGRADDASVRQRRAELLLQNVQPVADDRRRQQRVDESGCDQVHADG